MIVSWSVIQQNWINIITTGQDIIIIVILLQAETEAIENSIVLQTATEAIENICIVYSLQLKQLKTSVLFTDCNWSNWRHLYCLQTAAEAIEDICIVYRLQLKQLKTSVLFYRLQLKLLKTFVFTIVLQTAPETIGNICIHYCFTDCTWNNWKHLYSLLFYRLQLRQLKTFARLSPLGGRRPCTSVSWHTWRGRTEVPWRKVSLLALPSASLKAASTSSMPQPLFWAPTSLSSQRWTSRMCFCK